MSKHSVELAEMVVEAPDDYVIKNVATLIREIAKHSPEVRGQRSEVRGQRSGGWERVCPTKHLNLQNLNLY